MKTETIPSQVLIECDCCKAVAKPNRKWQNICDSCFLSKQRAASRRWRAKMGDEYRRRMVKRYHASIAAMTAEQLATFRRKEADKTKRRVASQKDEVFKAYGGWVCACCGERERIFLTIDHIEGNGRKMREIHGQTGDFYRWLKKNGFPPGFQILCMNCNFGKHQNGGKCPHQERRNDYPERE